MRQIALDTETTGLSTKTGHRVIEIGAVEIIDGKITGNEFQRYVNPKREVDPVALKIHGISNDFLADKQIFSEIVDNLLEFLGDSELIMHNAPFDINFIDNEFSLCNIQKNVKNYWKVIDTLVFARRRNFKSNNSLGSLCKRHGIDDSQRNVHGALIDAKLVAQLYLKFRK